MSTDWPAGSGGDVGVRGLRGGPDFYIGLVMPTERFYSVERIERKVAVLICGTDRVIVPLDQLPRNIDDGCVIGVVFDERGSPDWRSAQIDPAETELWKEEAGKLLAEALAKQSAGGKAPDPAAPPLADSGNRRRSR